MTARVFLAAWIAAFAMVAGLMPASPAQAHTGTTFYTSEWPSNFHEHWVLDSGVPPGDFRDSVAWGLGRWSNGAGGHGPSYILDGVVAEVATLNACANSRSIVFAYDDLGSALGAAARSVLGITRLCRNNTPQGSTISNFLIQFELNANYGASVGWNRGSDPAPPDRYDLRSTATHEAGHSTGWFGHFDFGSAQCELPLSGAFETMCEGTTATLGTEWRRTLGTHDLHTYESAY